MKVVGVHHDDFPNIYYTIQPCDPSSATFDEKQTDANRLSTVDSPLPKSSHYKEERRSRYNTAKHDEDGSVYGNRRRRSSESEESNNYDSGKGRSTQGQGQGQGCVSTRTQVDPPPRLTQKEKELQHIGRYSNGYRGGNTHSTKPW